ncbi:MAG TPA: TIR domain-containing protein [Gemmataceae bacterium]|nr:TIR domain-containing protein [Gemmataceae bacterium]
MSAPTLPSRPPLFLSYGHSDATDLARRLRADLDAAGYDVRLDRQRIRTGQPWGEEAIRDGLDGARAVVALLSPHSTRLATTSPDRLTSVCLNEIYHAKYTARIPILPVLAAPCSVPLILNELHYTDLSDPAQYALRLPGLLEDVAAALDGKPRYRAGHDWLDPLSFDAALEKRQGFVGRRWLFDWIEDWASNRHERAAVIYGPPGVGKTAALAELAVRNPGGRVLACHFCDAGNPDKRDPARFVQTLAFQLAGQLEPVVFSDRQHFFLLTTNNNLRKS